MADNPVHLQFIQLEDRDVPATSNLFDSAFYLRQNPDVAAVVMRGETSAQQHFRTFGDREHRSGNPAFDPAFYLNNYADVRITDAAGALTPFAHFEHWGQFERRDPSIDFNTADYLNLNPDVRLAVDTDEVSAFEHFFRWGQHEGRIPVFGFARRDYLNDNPDVAAASNHQIQSAVLHYMNFGRFESRDRPVATTIAWPNPESPTITGTSQNSNDPELFALTPPVSGNVVMNVSYTSANPSVVSVENALTNVLMFTRYTVEPNQNTSYWPVPFTSGEPYILRIRSSDDNPTTYAVTLTLVDRL